MSSPVKTSKIDSVDRSDRPIGQIARGRALAAGANFRTCHVFVFDSDGKLLLQRLASSRDRFPDRWGSSVAAYLHAGERYVEAARRRMREELELCVPLHYLGKTRMTDEQSLKFVALFTALSDKAEIGDRTHIAELRFWSIDEIARQAGRRPADFTPTFLALFRFYQTTLEGLGRAA